MKFPGTSNRLQDWSATQDSPARFPTTNLLHQIKKREIYPIRFRLFLNNNAQCYLPKLRKSDAKFENKSFVIFETSRWKFFFSQGLIPHILRTHRVRSRWYGKEIAARPVRGRWRTIIRYTAATKENVPARKRPDESPPGIPCRALPRGQQCATKR
jgi:hypothetical protein